MSAAAWKFEFLDSDQLYVPILIDMYKVSYVQYECGFTRILLDINGEWVSVKETPSQILAMIEEAK